MYDDMPPDPFREPVGYPIMGWVFILLAVLVATPTAAVILWALNR